MGRVIAVFLLNLWAGSISAIELPEVTLEIVDDADRPIAGAAARFLSRRHLLSEVTTDRDGKVTVDLPVGSKTTPPILGIEVQHPEFSPASTTCFAVNGTQRTIKISLRPKIVTTLRFLEKDGSAAVHQVIARLHGTPDFVADSKGEFRFAHPPLKEPWQIQFRDQIFNVEGRELEVIQPDDRSYHPLSWMPSLYGFRWSEIVQEPLTAPRVQGKVLQPNGTPATGWLIASQTRKGVTSMAILGLMLPETTHQSMHYRELSPLDEDGGFELVPTSTDLILISPNGLPFRYPLNRSAWEATSYVKELTITVPKIKKATLKLVDANGAPLSGIEIIPQTIGSYYDGWSLTPDRPSSQNGYYVGRQEPPSLESALNLQTSDANGEINVPIHPWLPIDALLWRKRGTSAPWEHVHFLRHSHDEPLILVSSKTSSYSKSNYRTLICSFKDTAGSPIAARDVSWRVGKGRLPEVSTTDGFYHSDGEANLIVAHWVDRIEFSHTAHSGVKEDSLNLIDPDGDLEQRIEVQFPNQPTQSKLAIRGRVRTHLGKPAEGVRLHLIQEKKNGFPDYLQIVQTTDGDGRFHIPRGPKTCKIHLSTSWQRHHIRLENVVDRPSITENNRDLDIQFGPASPVRIVLENAKHLPRNLMLRRVEDENVVDHQRLILHASYDDPAVFFSPYVPVGSYQLVVQLGDDFINLKSDPITIGNEGDEISLNVEATAELKNPPVVKPAIPVRVTVLRDGTPVPGVIVQSKQQAVPQPGAEHIQSRRAHVFSYVGDTTDNAGHAWFTVPPNSSLIVAAIDHERRIGWERIEVSSETDEITVNLRPQTEKESIWEQVNELLGIRRSEKEAN